MHLATNSSVHCSSYAFVLDSYTNENLVLSPIPCVHMAVMCSDYILPHTYYARLHVEHL